MDLNKLKELAAQNEARIDDHENYSSNIPYYYTSLRKGFEAYFQTFHTQSSYNFYLYDLDKPKSKSGSSSNYIDEENTVLTIINFQRFFELLLKGLLKKVHKDLILSIQYKVEGVSKKCPSKMLIGVLESGQYEKLPNTINFSETIDRVYYFFKAQKSDKSSRLTKKIKEVFSFYDFIDSNDVKSTFKFINWYRDRILHNGNKLPNLWFLDFFVSQEIVPLVIKIIEAENVQSGHPFFYFTTPSSIKILKEIEKLEFNIKGFDNSKMKEIHAKTLIKLGHLKALGRSSITLSLFKRNNYQETYEDDFRNPKERALRFANFDLEYFKINKFDKKEYKAIRIVKCNCCSEKTLVVYEYSFGSLFQKENDVVHQFAKCMFCLYYIQHRDVGDPFDYQLSDIRIFGR